MGSKPIVLIVDDVELNRALLSDLLKDQYEVVEASDGFEALARLKEYGASISIMLLDVVMPKLDGFGVLLQMKESGLTGEIPVIIISVDDSHEYIYRSYELGAVDYICRPFDAYVIKKRIANTILLQIKKCELDRLVEVRIQEGAELTTRAGAGSHSGGISDRTLFLLEQERIKYQFLAALSNEVLFEYDVTDDRIRFSDRVHEELGVASVIGGVSNDYKSLKFLSSKDLKEIIQKVMHTTPEKPFIQNQYLVKLPDGSRKWYEFTMRTMWGGGARPVLTGVIGKMTNIHNTKLENVRLKEMAEQDPLTKLYNHATAKRLIEEIIEQYPQEEAAFLFFDFDNFKTVNDTLGHSFGDRILCHIAESIKSAIRIDDIAARVGGDEFIVFMRNVTKLSELESRVEQLLNALCGTYERYAFSVSIGVAVYPADGHSYETLYIASDKALYMSKGTGKARYSFCRHTKPQKNDAP